MKQIALSSLVVAALSVSQYVAAAAEPTVSPSGPAGASAHVAPTVFAVVNGATISAQDFDQAAKTAYRQKFYHGKPPEAEVNRLLRETGQSLIDRALLAQEIAKQQIAPDKSAVDAELASYDARYANSPAWKEQREKSLPQLRAFLEDKSRQKVLEETVRKSVKPDTEGVRRYYAENPSVFTEPEKVRVSTILLKVDPSASSEVWKQAMAEGETLRKQLASGTDFAETARLRSGDTSSAENGGDMGYVHRGMLGDQVHEALDKVEPGAIIGPVRLLQGAALFKLQDRKTPQLQPFEKVAARAEGLLQREMAEQAWKDFLSNLRSKAKIDVDPGFAQIMQNETTPSKTN